MAWSLDGLSFTRESLPVFYPQEDKFKSLEWEGGAEDPRIVEDENGTYFMTYTAYDGDKAQLLIASSPDLRNWTKYGSVFKADRDLNSWTKSGSIVTRLVGSRLVAQRINDKYWMYFGDTNLFIASSDDLIKWDPVVDQEGEWKTVLTPRPENFDNDLVEPGPPAMIVDQGILLIYNSRNMSENYELPIGTYAAGQALFSLEDPTRLMDRSQQYFFHPTKDYEITGQVNNVCFLEGLSFYKGNWYLYYGTADSKIAVAKR